MKLKLETQNGAGRMGKKDTGVRGRLGETSFWCSLQPIDKQLYLAKRKQYMLAMAKSQKRKLLVELCAVVGLRDVNREQIKTKRLWTLGTRSIL